MDTNALQRRVPELTHLLSSQREWLERLLFQLAFNQNSQIFVVGSQGSGKSTTVMAIAELFSEQFNIALLNRETSEKDVPARLMQQWFAAAAIPDVSLTEQVMAADSQLPLLLVVDDAEYLSIDVQQQLKSIPCIAFFFTTPNHANTGFSLTLNRITSSDAAQLLQHESLNSIELAQRVAIANGNMHLLLLPPPQSELLRGSVGNTFLTKSVMLYFIAALILFSTLVVYFWPKPEISSPVNKTKVVIPPAPVQIDDKLIDDKEAFADVETDMPATIVEQEGTATIENAEVEADAAEVSALNQGMTVQELVKPEPAEQSGASLDISSESDVTSGLVVVPEADDASAANVSYVYDEVDLLGFNKQHISIQLAVLSSDNALQLFKRSYPELTTLAYQRNWQGVMQIIVLVAPFDNAQDAKMAMTKLPAALQASGPFVKALQAVQAEIRARQFSQQNSELH